MELLTLFKKRRKLIPLNLLKIEDSQDNREILKTRRNEEVATPLSDEDNLLLE